MSLLTISLRKTLRKTGTIKKNKSFMVKISSEQKWQNWGIILNNEI